jgi:hypothetical protein
VSEDAAATTGCPTLGGPAVRQLLEASWGDFSRVRTESVDAGHTLFVEGAPSSNLYVILTGSASVRKNGRRIARLGPGDVVGELSVILGGPRTATVEAETPIEWLVLDRASLRRRSTRFPASDGTCCSRWRPDSTKRTSDRCDSGESRSPLTPIYLLTHIYDTRML